MKPDREPTGVFITNNLDHALDSAQENADYIGKSVDVCNGNGEIVATAFPNVKEDQGTSTFGYSRKLEKKWDKIDWGHKKKAAQA